MSAGVTPHTSDSWRKVSGSGVQAKTGTVGRQVATLRAVKPLLVKQTMSGADSISAAAQKSLECTVGWTAHYAIGVVFALVFVALVSGDWLVRPTLMPALLYGIGTVVFPFFIMQPSFGLGIASSKAPNPTQAKLKSIMTHAVFGVGLWVCALGVNYALRGLA